KAHRDAHIGARGLPAIHGVDAGEMLEHKPRADPQLGAPLTNRRVQVRDHVGHLDDAVVGLTETYLTHNASPAPPLLASAPHSTCSGSRREGSSSPRRLA